MTNYYYNQYIGEERTTVEFNVPWNSTTFSSFDEAINKMNNGDNLFILKYNLDKSTTLQDTSTTFDKSIELSDTFTINKKINICGGYDYTSYPSQVEDTADSQSYTKFIPNENMKSAAFYIGNKQVLRNLQFENFGQDKTSLTDPLLGGAIHLSFGEITNCKFINCSAYNGGAIYMENSSKIIDSLFENCFQNDDGGAVYILNGNSINCRFNNCISLNGNGGGLYIYDGNLSRIFCNECIAKRGGAAYLEYSATINKDDSLPEDTTLSGNSINLSVLPYNLYPLYYDAQTTTYDSTNETTVIYNAFLNNQSMRGGALYLSNRNCGVYSAQFQNNIASDYGKDIFSNDGQGKYENIIIDGQVDTTEEDIFMLPFNDDGQTDYIKPINPPEEPHNI